MSNITPREVIEATIVKDYTVVFVFDDLKKGVVDLRPFLGKGIFKELLDPNKFRQMKVDAELGTICWPNGADIAPDRLYAEAMLSEDQLSGVTEPKQKHNDKRDACDR